MSRNFPDGGDFFPFIVFSVLDRASELNENMLFVLKILVLLPKFSSKDYYFAFEAPPLDTPCILITSINTCIFLIYHTLISSDLSIQLRLLFKQ